MTLPERIIELLSRPGPPLTGRQMSEILSISSGRLYPALFTLEQSGAIGSRWEMMPPKNRPRRRLYSAPAMGAEQ